MTEIPEDVIKKPVEVVDRQTSVEVFHLLSRPMPGEALKGDSSRGVDLTSINQAFVLERLQEVFGLLGYGWRFFPGPHWRETITNGEEILVEVAVQWRVTDAVKEGGHSLPVIWQRRIDVKDGVVVEGWEYGIGAQVWSEPVIVKGGASTNRRGSTRGTDAHRAAVTNALTKAASYLGVGLEVYKNQDELSLAANEGDGRAGGKGGEKRRRASRPERSSSNNAPRQPRKAGAGFADLEAIQKAAQAEVAKLTFEDTQPQAKTIQQLAQKMSSMGFTMQTNRLVHVLLGEGWSQKGVMALHNLLLRGLSEANIALINESAFQ